MLFSRLFIYIQLLEYYLIFILSSDKNTASVEPKSPTPAMGENFLRLFII